MTIIRQTARLGALVLAVAAGLAGAHEYRVGSITVGHPHARATLPGQASGGVFLQLRNQGAADRLLAASTPAAEHVELHRMAMEGDVMRMRALDALDVPAGQTVKLAPGGLHLMLFGLKVPLEADMRFPLELRFEKAGTVKVEVVVDGAAKATEHAH